MGKKLLILMAHYNNPDGLEASLLSIREPFPVDVLIVDDGSSQNYNEDHLRKIYTNGTLYFEALEENEGVGAAANKALERAQQMEYELLGRLDCGDINYNNKYNRQLEYLSQNPDVKLLGTWARVIDHNGNFLHMLKHPQSYGVLKKKMYLNSMFLNPSVVFYSDILDVVGNYPYKYRRASQDYAFFFKVIKHYKAENLPEVLMDYIVDPSSISTTKRRLQVKNRMLIVLDNFYFGFYPIAGLIRSAFLLLFPRWVTTSAKKILQK
jgi:hypothetical protein